MFLSKRNYTAERMEFVDRAVTAALSKPDLQSAFDRAIVEEGRPYLQLLVENVSEQEIKNSSAFQSFKKAAAGENMFLDANPYAGATSAIRIYPGQPSRRMLRLHAGSSLSD